MPADTALSRVTKSDFFAILGSGTCVVASCGLLVAAVFSGSQSPSAHETISWLSGVIERHWPMAVASLFLAFLIGNALRALPVNWADALSKQTWELRKWFREKCLKQVQSVEKTAKEKYMQALWENPFPYAAMLEFELNALKENLPDLNITIPPQGTRHSMYNFWKAEICRESTAAFEFTQELEGRVRLFATMIWAALVGLLVGIFGLPVCAARELGTGWAMVMLLILCLSALISLVFGSQLRRVRGQEVASVFIAYVSLTLKRAREKESS